MHSTNNLSEITHFDGEYKWLSNFWNVPIVFDGVTYMSVEHAYVAAKTLDFEQRRKIAEFQYAGQAKRYGRSLVLRPDWEDVKLIVMEQLLRQKFSDPELKQKLIDTRDNELIEGNNWGDKFWGVCNGSGHNHLGKLIMIIRNDLILESFYNNIDE